VCLQCFDAVGWAAGSASSLRKTEWWGGGVVICLERGADLHTAQLMPLPLTVSYFSKIQIGFTFLVPTHPGSPGKRAVKWVCVSVSVWPNSLGKRDKQPNRTSLCGTTSSPENAAPVCGRAAVGHGRRQLAAVSQRMILLEAAAAVSAVHCCRYCYCCVNLASDYQQLSHQHHQLSTHTSTQAFTLQK